MEQTELQRAIEAILFAAGERMEVARLACADGDTLHNMPFPVTPESVYAAILAADELGKLYSGV